jgi:anaphase-promoting complex subunit 11
MNTSTPLSASAAAIEASFLSSPASSAMEMSPGEAGNNSNITTTITEAITPFGSIQHSSTRSGERGGGRGGVDKKEMEEEIRENDNHEGTLTTKKESLRPDGTVNSGESINGEGRGLTVKVTSSRFVAAWRWTVAEADEVCGICRMPFESCCPSCKFAGDECPPLVGVCKHAYHLHCIHNWLAAKDKEQVCPLCRRTWE